ncbi:hypothetical protein BDQ17DRAFT_244332 [Cyathus striatus]|nr:hypothetical protein BDQ17DRAFT_244332 [Cyathus striatus]
MLLLLLPAAYRAFKLGGKSTLVTAVIREGIFFYIYLFIVTLVNLVVLLKLSPDYFALLPVFSRVVQSALSCRVVLHVREKADTSRVHGIKLSTISGNSV